MHREKGQQSSERERGDQVFGEHTPVTAASDDSHLQRQLKAGERILTQVTREKNKLHDANIRLDVELKDVHTQLVDSVKENKRLRRGIYGKSSSELCDSSARKFLNFFCLQEC